MHWGRILTVWEGSLFRWSRPGKEKDGGGGDRGEKSQEQRERFLQESKDEVVPRSDSVVEGGDWGGGDHAARPATASETNSADGRITKKMDAISKYLRS